MNTHYNNRVISQDQNILEQPLISFHSKMKDLISFSSNEYPLTDRIFDLINVNNSKLKKIIFEVPINERPLSEVYQLIQSLNLEELQLNYSQTFNYIKLNRTPCNLLTNSTYLTHLMICGCMISSFIEVFQNLPVLESLTVQQLQLDSNYTLLNNKTIKNCGLKIMDIQILAHGTHSGIHQLNRSFNFLLQSCPLLEQFKISGDLWVTYQQIENLNFCFLHNEKINTICIDLTGLQYYYTFNEQPKGWRSYNSKDRLAAIEYGPSENNSFHINLDVKGNVVMFRLMECGQFGPGLLPIYELVR